MVRNICTKIDCFICLLTVCKLMMYVQKKLPGILEAITKIYKKKTNLFFTLRSYSFQFERNPK